VIEFLTANWLWILFVLAMVAMHRHGGCGGHNRGQASHRDEREQHDGRPNPPVRPTEPSHDTRSMP
jgi:hypothetical protein